MVNQISGNFIRLARTRCLTYFIFAWDSLYSYKCCNLAASAAPRISISPPSPSYMEDSELDQAVSQQLMSMSYSSGGKPVKAKGARATTPVEAAYIMTPQGQVPAQTQITLERKVDRDEHGEHIHK